LRSPDPRFIALQEFCDKRPELLASPTIQLVKQTYEVAPGVLTEHGKTKNPWPNVDAASGCVLYHYGLTQFKVWRSSFSLSELETDPLSQYYTVIFGVSRGEVIVSRSFLLGEFPDPLQLSDVCRSWSGPVVRPASPICNVAIHLKFASSFFSPRTPD
jgi:hypothetical protein